MPRKSRKTPSPDDPATLPEPSLLPAPAPAEAGLERPADTFRHYMRQIARYPRLSREEEHEFAVRYRRYGDPEAAYRLVTGNLRLVIRIALEYRRAFLNLLDLVQEGNIGLMQAVKKYDPLRGVPFSSYAAWWIRAYILKHLLDHWSIVKVGTTNTRRRLFFNLKKEMERLERSGATAGPKLLAEAFDASEEDVIDVSRALLERDVSLDAPVGEDGDRHVWETIPVEETAPDEAAAREELRDILRDKLAAFSAGLDEKERFVLERRLAAEDPITLQAIGDHFGVTRESARLVEKKVIARLRDYLRSEIGDMSVFEVADDDAHRPASPVVVERRRRKKPGGR